MRIHGPRELPANWRTTAEGDSTAPGLTSLDASGSGQFCLDQFYKMQMALAGKWVTVVDLRHEPHGIINAAAISWGPPAPASRGAWAVEQLEAQWLTALEGAKRATATFYAPGSFANRDAWQPIELKFDIRSVSTEARMVDAARWGYLRIAAPDFTAPRDEDVDRFVKLVRELEPGMWLHFHCDTGRGRTTLFMTLYDMLRNYVRASRGDIIQRQRRLGGIDLLAAKAGSAEASRADFLTEFYHYCWAEGPGFRRSWSSWRRTRAHQSSKP